MAEPIPSDEQINHDTFRDCFSEPVLRTLAAPTEKTKKKKRHGRKGKEYKVGTPKEKGNEPKTTEVANATEDQASAEDLGEFIEYLSSVIFPSLPFSLRTLTHTRYKDSPHLQDTYSTPLTAPTTLSLLKTLSPTAVDSLESYGLLPPSPDSTDLHNLFTPILTSYITACTAPPPIWSSTRTTECELCSRSWIPLSYHHLIPKSTHERVLKRRWHPEDQLNSVAWLCRACHSFVHRLAGNEELAKSFYTVDLIREGGTEGDEEKRDEVEKWVKWVGGVRWKSR